MELPSSPNRSGPLRLRLTNPSDQPVRVTVTSASVSEPIGSTVATPWPSVTLAGYNELLEFEDVEDAPLSPEDVAGGVLSKRGNWAVVVLNIADVDADPAAQHTVQLEFTQEPAEGAEPSAPRWRPLSISVVW